MQTRCSIFVAASLDGYIARTDGSIDWLTDGRFQDPGEDYGYQAFMQSVDAIVIGRHSFETAAGFDPWPYTGKRVVVLSNHELAVPAALAGAVEIMRGAPQAIVARLAGEGASHLYIDGGITLQGFLAAGLIDQMIVTRVPLLLGKGIPLFGTLQSEQAWRHVTTTIYPSGLVQSRYERGAEHEGRGRQLR